MTKTKTGDLRPQDLRDGNTSKIRSRVQELRYVKVGDLKPNPQNWRTHPHRQQLAIRGVLNEVGYADALLAREGEDGELVLIDGHLRAEVTDDEQEVPVLILDVDEDEAKKILVTLDPMAGMAETDKEELRGLLEEVETQDQGVEALLRDLEKKAAEVEVGEDPQYPIVPKMMEEYSYVVIFTENEMDFAALQTMLGLETEKSYKNETTGIGRVVRFAKFKERWDDR